MWCCMFSHRRVVPFFHRLSYLTMSFLRRLPFTAIPAYTSIRMRSHENIWHDLLSAMGEDASDPGFGKMDWRQGYVIRKTRRRRPVAVA